MLQHLISLFSKTKKNIDGIDTSCNNNQSGEEIVEESKELADSSIIEKIFQHNSELYEQQYDQQQQYDNQEQSVEMFMDLKHQQLITPDNNCKKMLRHQEIERLGLNRWSLDDFE